VNHVPDERVIPERKWKGKRVMKNALLFLICFWFIVFSQAELLAQGRIYDGPDDGAGDPFLEREAFMNGNRVQLLFKNNTELGDYPRKDACRWPKGVGGNVMHDGLGLLITAPVFLTRDSIPVTDTLQIRSLSLQGLIDTLFYCETNYREEMDRDPTGQIEWGLHPAPGYMNNLSERPAMSNDPNSWPPQGWLYTDRQTHWPGEWDGRFGRGQIKSDLEAYIVANDAQDLEYLGDDDQVKYYPRPGLHIGDIDPNVTVQKGEPWGGLGVRVKQRLFQWNNSMAQDCIFSEYTIANISEYDLPYMAFGAWLDNDIGGENSGEDGSFLLIGNMSYQWDTDGVGEDGYRTGTAGYAYLESPGIYNDMKDNDRDGLIDERRDNPAGEKIGPYDGITDLSAFLYFYGMQEADLSEHYEGDEDQDWEDGLDVNNDGVYQADEFAGDDVGLDGVAPGEENYYGPDMDGTECNHKPDLGEGYAEPNFGWTDVSETDMLGLTTLIYTEAIPHEEPYTGWFRNDESMWRRMTMTDSLESGATNINNLFELFSTAIFPLYKGNTQFISIGQLHSYEDLAGLNSAEHAAPALFTLKKTVQLIYEKDYRFAQPPKMPTLTAIPGDGFVQLIWDNRADRLTREAFLNGKNDFEGYKVYRSTDSDMKDPQVITDGFGTETFMKPIFQCDIKDGRRGFTDYGLLNGAGYYLGEDTGIAYSFKDETVQNGRTYYYAVVAYDYGIRPDELKGTSVIQQDDSYGISPSENNAVFRKDEYEDIEFIGANTAIVTPGSAAAGEFLESDFEVLSEAAIGNGQIIPKVVDLNSLNKDHIYKVKFIVEKLDSAYNYHSGFGYKYTASGLQVFDQTLENNLVYEDILMTNDRGIQIPKNMNTVLELYNNETLTADDDFYHITTTGFKETEIFDGMQLQIRMGNRFPEYNYEESGWMPGESPINLIFIEAGLEFYSWDYNIVFYDHTVYQSQVKASRLTSFRDENNVRLDRDNIFENLEWNFAIQCINFTDSLGQHPILDVMGQDLDGDLEFNILKDRVLVGSPINSRNRWDALVFILDFSQVPDESALPKPGDVYAMRFNKPWWETDSLTFRVSANKMVDQTKVKSAMEDIRVVPNPYVATNMMEPSVVNKWLNQSRRLLFTNLPQRCTIKIFTTSGILIRKLSAPEDALTGYNGYGQSNTGIMHWDMLTEEGLEIAAGMYFYHVKDNETGEEISGKFAIIK
jgi:hypothetical protein